MKGAGKKLLIPKNLPIHLGTSADEINERCDLQKKMDGDLNKELRKIFLKSVYGCSVNDKERDAFTNGLKAVRNRLIFSGKLTGVPVCPDNDAFITFISWIKNGRPQSVRWILKRLGKKVKSERKWKEIIFLADGKEPNLSYKLIKYVDNAESNQEKYFVNEDLLDYITHIVSDDYLNKLNDLRPFVENESYKQLMAATQRPSSCREMPNKETQSEKDDSKFDAMSLHSKSKYRSFFKRTYKHGPARYEIPQPNPGYCNCPEYLLKFGSDPQEEEKIQARKLKALKYRMQLNANVIDHTERDEDTIDEETSHTNQPETQCSVDAVFTGKLLKDYSNATTRTILCKESIIHEPEGSFVLGEASIVLRH
ncbi:hypothetical protein ACOME3_009495 [Neoechinorhynchus agilis]